MFYSSKTVFRFVFHKVIEVVVDHAVTLRSATTESGSQTVDDDVLGISLVFLAQLFSELFSGNIGLTRMDDFENLEKIRD